MKQRARQHAGLVASVVALLVFWTSLTHAILNGTLDGNLHPNVGVVIFAVDGELFSPCSGNLIAPTVFVTAAHCVEYIESVGATQVWVTFASHVPADVDFIDVSNLDTSTLIPGTLHPNPAFDAHAPDPNDVAVITFETPVTGITPAVLPTAGLLDELGEQNGLKDQLFTVVGYGVNQRIVGGGPTTYLRDLSRRFATSGLNALGPALLRLSMNRAKGYGGASFADSGGGIFFGQSNTLVAIVGLRGTQGMYQGYRLDTASARASSPASLLFRTRWGGPKPSIDDVGVRDETGERSPGAHRSPAFIQLSKDVALGHTRQESPISVADNHCPFWSLDLSPRLARRH